MPIAASWSNDTQTNFMRSYAGSLTQGLTERIVQSPADQLPRMGGTTSFVIDEILKDVATGDSWLYSTWQNGSYWFGTKLIFPFQFFHAGYAPYWQIAGGPSAPATADEIVWRTAVSDPSVPYLYTAQADQLPPGLKIYCVPKAGGQDLSVDVTISNVSG